MRSAFSPMMEYTSVDTLVYARLYIIGQLQVHAHANHGNGWTEHIAMQLDQYACQLAHVVHVRRWAT